MKRYKNIFLAVLASLALFACEDDDKLVLDYDLSTAPETQTPVGSELNFTIDNADSTILFSWTESELNVNVVCEYQVQFSTDNFTNVIETVATTMETSAAVRVSTINNALLTMELPIGAEATIQSRVACVLSPNAAPLTSAVSTFSVMPYETLINYPMIYVPGAYQGWSPGAENGRLYSYNFDDTYEGIIRIGGTDGHFKITPEAAWDVAWGGTLAAVDGGYTASLDGSGPDLDAAPGTYQFTVDVNAMTLSMQETDDWGIIGSSVPPYDWSADVDMNYNGQRQMWEITTELQAGVIKFRANDDWGLNYGSDDAAGVLNAGGSDIPVETAGTYLIRIDLENLVYTIELVE